MMVGFAVMVQLLEVAESATLEPWVQGRIRENRASGVPMASNTRPTRGARCVPSPAQHVEADGPKHRGFHPRGQGRSRHGQRSSGQVSQVMVMPASADANVLQSPEQPSVQSQSTAWPSQVLGTHS